MFMPSRAMSHASNLMFIVGTHADDASRFSFIIVSKPRRKCARRAAVLMHRTSDTMKRNISNARSKAMCPGPSR